MRHRNRLIALLVAAWAGCAWGQSASQPATVSLNPLQQALDLMAADMPKQAEPFALEAAKDNPRAWVVVAAARQRQAQYRLALQAYRKYLASCDSPDLRDYAHEQMTLCQRGLPRWKAARPPSNQLEPAQFNAFHDVDEISHRRSTENFTIHARNSELADFLAVESERALRRICDNLLAKRAYPHEIELYVWPTRSDYLANAADAPDWSGGSSTFAVRDGLVVRRIDLTQFTLAGKFDLRMVDRVLPHELCHLVLKEFFQDTSCPLFLEEGMAMLAESATDPQRVLLAGAAMSALPRATLEDLLAADSPGATDAAAFYALAFSFAEFLRSSVTDAQFAQLLQHLRGGCSFQDALERSLLLAPQPSMMTKIDAAWHDYAIEQAHYMQALRSATEPASAPARQTP